MKLKLTNKKLKSMNKIPKSDDKNTFENDCEKIYKWYWPVSKTILRWTVFLKGRTRSIEQYISCYLQVA